MLREGRGSWVIETKAIREVAIRNGNNKVNRIHYT